MKNKLIAIINELLVVFLLISCGQINSNNAVSSVVETHQAKQIVKTKEELIADSLASAKQIKLNKVYETEQEEKFRLAIKLAEKDFFSSLKAVDNDYGENNFSRINKILKHNKKTAYDLYIELSEMRKEAVYVAKDKGIEKRANGQERILSNYYYYLENEMKIKEANFKSKYGFDNRLLLCFRNNYCSCLGNNSDKYCSGRQPVFPNAEFWNK